MEFFRLFDGWNELPNTDKQIRGEEANSDDFPEPGETVLLTVQDVYRTEERGKRRVVTSSLVPAPVGSTYRWEGINNNSQILAWKPTPNPYES